MVYNLVENVIRISQMTVNFFSFLRAFCVSSITDKTLPDLTIYTSNMAVLYHRQDFTRLDYIYE